MSINKIERRQTKTRWVEDCVDVNITEKEIQSAAYVRAYEMQFIMPGSFDELYQKAREEYIAERQGQQNCIMEEEIVYVGKLKRNVTYVYDDIIDGTSGRDKIKGSNADETIYGRGDNDVIIAGGVGSFE